MVEFGTSEHHVTSSLLDLRRSEATNSPVGIRFMAAIGANDLHVP